MTCVSEKCGVRSTAVGLRVPPTPLSSLPAYVTTGGIIYLGQSIRAPLASWAGVSVGAHQAASSQCGTGMAW